MKFNIKNKRYLATLIATTMLVSMVPLFIITTFSYFNTKKMITEQSVNSSKTSMMQVAEATDVIFRQVEATCMQMILDGNINRLIAYPMGTYYEELNEKYREAGAEDLYEYLTLKKDSRIFITMLTGLNNYLDSIYISYGHLNLIQSSRGSDIKGDKFWDLDWMEYTQEYNENIAYPYYMDTRAFPDYNGTFVKNVITILYKSTKRSKGVYYIFNIDASELLKDIDSMLTINNIGEFYILSDDGKIVLTNKSDSMLQNWNKIENNIPVEKTDDIVSNISEDNKTLVTQYHLGNGLPWTIILVKNMDELYSKIGFLKRILALIAFVCLVLVLILAFVLDLSVYKPIRSLVSQLTNMVSDKKDIAMINDIGEIEYIRENLNKFLVENERLGQDLRESLISSKERFLLRLIEGQITDNNLYQQTKLIKLNIEMKNILPILIMVDWDAENDQQIDYKLNEILLHSYLSDLIGQNYPCEILELGRGYVLSLININEYDSFSTQDYIGNVQSQLAQISKCPILIATGEFCDGVTNVRESYSIARLKIRNQMISGNRDNMDPVDKITFKNARLNNMIDLFNDSIKTGDYQEMSAILSNIKESLSEQRHEMSYSQIRHQLLRVLIIIVNELYILKYDFVKIMGCRDNIYEQFLSINDFDQIISYINNVMDKIEPIFNEKPKQEAVQNYVNQIINILNEDCSINISLESVSEKIGLTSVYVSKLFKNSTGENFTKYLTQVRINKAKELLIGTNMKVKDIAVQIGYSNSYYFIRVFKEYTSVTPGEYKKIMMTNN